MYNYNVFILLFISAIFKSSQSLSLPPYIKPCPVLSSGLKECAIQHGNEAIPILIKGDRTYGIPPFNPLKIPFVRAFTGDFDMNMTNLVFNGMEKTKLVDFNIDKNTRHSGIKLRAPFVELIFDYSVSGKIASLPIEGNGKGKMEVVNGIYGYEFDYKLVKRDGKTFLDISNDQIKIEPERINADLRNLFGGNEQLGLALNEFLNENWKELLNEFGPTISKIFGAVARKVLDQLMQKIPVDELFSDWKERT